MKTDERKSQENTEIIFLCRVCVNNFKPFIHLLPHEVLRSRHEIFFHLIRLLCLIHGQNIYKHIVKSSASDLNVRDRIAQTLNEQYSTIKTFYLNIQDESLLEFSSCKHLSLEIINKNNEIRLFIIKAFRAFDHGKIFALKFNPM
ncbi:CLUMA_CG015471, isoform A [Clunio marinus]|uniref:CLUMA_CG015471, isoform A n=1 Tax=Clunio marinus TaxID=568069 RepID=A0A1J1IUE2_9DIPT|nr:CLUMA_CG015471, isoform A [Clunio marinus]